MEHRSCVHFFSYTATTAAQYNAARPPIKTLSQVQWSCQPEGKTQKLLLLHTAVTRMLGSVTFSLAIRLCLVELLKFTQTSLQAMTRQQDNNKTNTSPIPPNSLNRPGCQPDSRQSGGNPLSSCLLHVLVFYHIVSVTQQTCLLVLVAPRMSHVTIPVPCEYISSTRPQQQP